METASPTAAKRACMCHSGMHVQTVWARLVGRLCHVLRRPCVGAVAGIKDAVLRCIVLVSSSSVRAEA